VLSPMSRAEQDRRRWIEKPNSLCFGLGNVTILTVVIDLPKVLTPVLSSVFCLGCVNLETKTMGSSYFTMLKSGQDLCLFL